MIPWNEKEGLSKADNPVLRAVRSAVADRGWVGQPITPDLLEEVGAALSKATRHPCAAFHEVALVPASDGMVRVRVSHASGPWVLTAFKSPSLKEIP